MKTLLAALFASALLAGQPSVSDTLITYSATDFQTHQPQPADVRNVRLGYIPKGEDKLYVLCGEFLPTPDPDKAGWTEFATVKTDPYEQWLGRAGFCDRPNMVWEDTGDLTPALKDKLGLK